jgi:hypothetical protein
MKGTIQERIRTCTKSAAIRSPFANSWTGGDRPKLYESNQGFEPSILKFIAKIPLDIIQIISEISTLNLKPFLEGSATLNELIFVNS